MAYPYTQHNSFRIYDRMVANWVNAIPVDYGNLAGFDQKARGLLWVYASPARAFAEMRDVLLRKGWVDPAQVGVDGMEASDWITVPLPFASITRMEPVWDATRSRVPWKFRKFIREYNQYRAVRHPLPYEITYNIEYWHRRKYTEAHILEWILSQVGPVGAANNEFFMTADFGALWGQKMIPVQAINVTDNSDLEPGEEDDITLRTSLTFTLKAWIFPPVETTTTPLVMRVVVEEEIQSRDGQHSFTVSEGHQRYDVVDELLENDPVLFEISSGVTQTGDKTWDVPSGGYIQTVDAPVFGGEDVEIWLDLDWGVTLPGGLTVEVQNYNRNPVHSEVIGAGASSAQKMVTVNLADFVNAVRVRLAPSDAVDLTVNDISVQMEQYVMP